MADYPFLCSWATLFHFYFYRWVRWRWNGIFVDFLDGHMRGLLNHGFKCWLHAPHWWLRNNLARSVRLMTRAYGLHRTRDGWFTNILPCFITLVHFCLEPHHYLWGLWDPHQSIPRVWTGYICDSHIYMCPLIIPPWGITSGHYRGVSSGHYWNVNNIYICTQNSLYPL